VDLGQWTWTVWLGIAVLCIVIELFTLDFTFAMLAVGALGGLVATLSGGPWWLQIVVAAVLAVLLLFLVRPFLRRVLRRTEDRTPQNVDAIAEQRGRVLAPFVHGAGEVKLENGETWSARLMPGAPPAQLAEGDRVVVVRVVGATVDVLPEPPLRGKEP